MNDRFILGSSEIANLIQYYIFDRVKKETLYFSSVETSGHLKNITKQKKELSELCAVLNKQNEEGLFKTETVTLTKKQAEYIASRLTARLTLCNSMLENCGTENHNCNSIHDEIETIHEIFTSLHNIRFDNSVLKDKVCLAEN